MTSILVVDDDPAIRRTLAVALRARGFEVHTVATGRDALQTVDEVAADLVLLDLGLPDMDGLTVLTRLRSQAQVPVIVLSGRTGSKDKIDALDQGAEDFVTKPFDIEELIARVRASSRRQDYDEPMLTVHAGGLTLDLTTRRATRTGTEINLSPTEWRIVDVLARRPGRLVRQRQLLSSLKDIGQPTIHELRAHIASIRNKLEVDPTHPSLIVTEPGTGYRFISKPRSGDASREP
jgi:two-component system KDP operon response regulator KdpE